MNTTGNSPADPFEKALRLATKVVAVLETSLYRPTSS